MLQVLQHNPLTAPITKISKAVNEVLLHIGHLKRSEGGSAESIEQLVRDSRPRVQLMTEGSKQFLNIEVLPRFL